MDVLHRHEVVTIDLAQIEDLDDVHVLKTDRDPSLIDEHLNELLILGHVVEDALDDENLLEARHPKGSGAIDLGHTARRDLLKQLVFAEMLGAHKPFRPDCNHP